MKKSIPLIERADREQIEAFQTVRLKEHLQYLAGHSPYYRRLFEKEAIEVSSFRSLADLAAFPVTTKEDFQKFNEEFQCVPDSKVVDYSCTSGTLGSPVTLTLTDNDLDRLAHNEFLSLGCAQGSEQDRYQLMTTIDKMFMAGMAYFLGARKLQAGIIRAGIGKPQMHWQMILRYKPNALIAVPSFIIKLLDFARANDIRFRETEVKKIICIGENIRNPDFSLNALGQRIAEQWDVKLYSTYASTEIGTAFTECEHGKGGHHQPELCVLECLDQNNQPVREGQVGELTITPLGIEGMPLLRYKTGDLAVLHTQKCECGRTTTRISPIVGRKRQMIKLKGTTLYPPAISNALNELTFIKNYVIEVSRDQLGLDQVNIFFGTDQISGLDKLSGEVKDHLQARLKVSPVVHCKTIEQINKMQFSEEKRKPVTFIDQRKLVPA